MTSHSADSTSVAAVLAQRSRQDRAELLEDLVALLAGVMPGVEVKRSLLSRNVKSVRVPLGEYAYVLQRAGRGAFEARRQQVVRGVVIRTDPMEIDAFVAELSTAIDAELRRTERGREALQSWLSTNS